jgi:hypothetical protein
MNPTTSLSKNYATPSVILLRIPHQLSTYSFHTNVKCDKGVLLLFRHQARTAYIEGTMSIFYAFSPLHQTKMQDGLHAMTIWLLGKQRPIPIRSQSPCWWLGGGGKPNSCPRREPTSSYSISNCSLVIVSNEPTRLTYKNCGSDNHMSLTTNALAWLT